jgi:hypothetical protein
METRVKFKEGDKVVAFSYVTVDKNEGDHSGCPPLHVELTVSWVGRSCCGFYGHNRGMYKEDIELSCIYGTPLWKALS